MDNQTYDILKSFAQRDSSVTSLDEIHHWIQELNHTTHVELTKVSLRQCAGWYMTDDGIIQNQQGSFFKVAGLCVEKDNKHIMQPIILQNEIGFLGILTKKINGILHFLMQAKIEPGNVNKIQISPTLQATKSNFTLQHGGRRPRYLEFFESAGNYKILYDQIQSEQSSRFLGKRNRNIIIDVGDEDIQLYKNWKWMTLGQIKELLKIDNLVNMDTRTVLSGLPIKVEEADSCPQFFDPDFFRTLQFSPNDAIAKVYHYINDFKMFSNLQRNVTSLKTLTGWKCTEDELYCPAGYHFKVVYYRIEIEGREVKRWAQPLFEATGMAQFVLLTSIINGKRYFLVHAQFEVGAFDFMELGPTLQKEPMEKGKRNSLEEYIATLIKQPKARICRVILSEEGGRFYHEQNENIILDADFDEVEPLRKAQVGYFWMDFSTLLRMLKINNILNIQLRNLLTLLDWDGGLI